MLCYFRILVAGNYTQLDKYLITGASGYLANTLMPLAAQVAEVVGVARHTEKICDPAQSITLDITDRNRVLDVIAAEKPDVIIHCAACNPGAEGDNSQAMQQVNHLGSEHVAMAARRLDCRLVAVSSDTVFNGVDAPFADDAVAQPLEDNLYAVSKALAEKAVLDICGDAIVVRTSLIYGLDTMDRGTRGFVERLHSGETLKLFDDVIRQPVLASSLSDCLLRLASDLVQESGTMNFAGSQSLSRAEFGIKLLKFWRVDFEGMMETISGQGVAGLPIDLRLKLDRATSLGLAMPGVSDALKQQKQSRKKK